MEFHKNAEFIQSIIRLGIGILTYAYISSGIDSGYFDTTMSVLNTFSLTFFGFTFLVAGSLIFKPVSIPRRYLSLAFDIGCATFSSYLTGGINSVYVLIYLWIYIGYGTRYGKSFLLAAMAMTFVGYNILIITENAWSMLTLDAIAFLLLIIALPIYLYSLQKRIQKAAIETEQANKAKTEFLSTMTHQIRTPIGGVVGMIDLLNKTRLDNQQKQYLQALSQSSNALQEIIEDIVDFSSIGQGNVSFDYKSIQPRTLINSLVHSLAPLAHEKGLELNCYINEKFPYNVFGDAQRLRQLLSNLIRHSIANCINNHVYVYGYANEINQEGEVKACIEISYHQDPKNDKIYASDLLSTEEVLALRVGSQLTRLLGGNFDIVYPSDAEAKLVLEFDWKLDEIKSNTPPQKFEDKRVLIYEPDDASRDILENYCKQLGMQTYSTGGNDNLVAHILWSREKNTPFDAIVLCETLKSNNSQELIHRIRHEANCEAPILYATYIQSIELTEPNILQDVQASIIKPFALEMLAHSFKHMFENEDLTVSMRKELEKQYRILLAEDSEINASIIYSHLTDLGHNVDIATDGNTALYAMHKHHYDIVFMDIHMPNMDGIEATRKWRRIEPKNKNLPVIAITAKATSEDRNQCFEAGMDGFLTKPVNANKLAEVLDSYL